MEQLPQMWEMKEILIKNSFQVRIAVNKLEQNSIKLIYLS